MRSLIPNITSYKNGVFLQQLRLQGYRKGYGNLEEYCEAIISGKEKLEEIKENMTYVGSHFFRGNVWPELQDLCRDSFLREGQKEINVWCAGCSSGKEVYSILMLLLEDIPMEKIKLLATDYNQEMLKRCNVSVGRF